MGLLHNSPEKKTEIYEAVPHQNVGAIIDRPRKLKKASAFIRPRISISVVSTRKPIPIQQGTWIFLLQGMGFILKTRMYNIQNIDKYAIKSYLKNSPPTRGQTLSGVDSVRLASFVPYLTASSRLFPLESAVTVAEKNASPAPVVS